MFELFVQASFRATPDVVFSVVSNHERFLRNHGIDRCTLTTEGADDRNGLGAVREVHAGPLVFVEEVVRFEPPVRYDYRIHRGTMLGRTVPMEHELGWLEVIDCGDHVEVDWRSRFRIDLPVVGRTVETVMGHRLEASFRDLLTQAKRDVA